MGLSSMHAPRSWLARHPMLKAVVKALLAPVRGGASTGYHQLGASERSGKMHELRHAWQSERIPERQRELVNSQLADYRNGAGNPTFDTLVRLLRPLAASLGSDSCPTVLEVGCSSGYHSEIFDIKELSVSYTGCDYSVPFIQLARRIYPSVQFAVADATSLPMDSGSFDIVVSGCCLLHIADYQTAIRETARVARRYVVLHRTPILHSAPTTFFRKHAYGVETIEIHFNEEELIGLLAIHGLRIIAVATLDLEWRAGDVYATKEYVCEKYATNSD